MSTSDVMNARNVDSGCHGSEYLSGDSLAHEVAVQCLLSEGSKNLHVVYVGVDGQIISNTPTSIGFQISGMTPTLSFDPEHIREDDISFTYQIHNPEKNSMFYYWLSNSSQDPDAGDIKTEALGGNSCAGSKPVTDSASYEITMKNCTLQENEDCTLFSSLESSDLINVKLSGAPNFHYETNPIPPPIQISISLGDVHNSGVSLTYKLSTNVDGGKVYWGLYKGGDSVNKGDVKFESSAITGSAMQSDIIDTLEHTITLTPETFLSHDVTYKLCWELEPSSGFPQCTDTFLIPNEDSHPNSLIKITDVSTTGTHVILSYVDNGNIGMIFWVISKFEIAPDSEDITVSLIKSGINGICHGSEDLANSSEGVVSVDCAELDLTSGRLVLYFAAEDLSNGMMQVFGPKFLSGTLEDEFGPSNMDDYEEAEELGEYSDIEYEPNEGEDVRREDKNPMIGGSHSKTSIPNLSYTVKAIMFGICFGGLAFFVGIYCGGFLNAFKEDENLYDVYLDDTDNLSLRSEDSASFI